MSRTKLVIISHTEHFVRNDEIVGWGATVEEINQISSRWDEVVHIACLYNGNAPAGSRAYANANIRFVPLKPTGGVTITDKLGVIINAPSTLRTISNELHDATCVQLRTPTGMGVYLLPAFSYLFKRDFRLWVKYAGNWSAKAQPYGYRFQRWWLSKNRSDCTVTINGSWPSQPDHCLTFENPCLKTSEIVEGRECVSKKRFLPTYRLLFVGRLDDSKGVDVILEAIKSVENGLIDCVDIVGDGAKREEYEALCKEFGQKVVFHGFLDRSNVHDLMANAHFLLLPSRSEGFPKVIAEAACYGCIPIVSRVGSIDQYINSTNGFLWNVDSGVSFAHLLQDALKTDEHSLRRKASILSRLATVFTYDHYIKRLEEEVLSN